MKLYLGSDLHIEFGPLEVHNRDNADVLILSGDIVIANDLTGLDNTNILEPSYKAKTFINFFEQCSSKFKDVIYVMGNHEHYHGDFSKSAKILRNVLKDFPNIHLLDKESKTIDDVTFVGGTLWTDMNKEDPNTLEIIRRKMNDFRLVDNSDRVVNYKTFEPLDKPVGMTDQEWLAKPTQDRNKVVFRTRTALFSPEDAVEEHKSLLKFIDEATTDKSKKYVVVGHHAPSKQSVKPRYVRDVYVNGGYSSDLSEFILDRPQIKMWTHGHTHDKFDYMIGTTRVVCNPRGYIDYEPCAYDFDFQLLEI